MEYWGPEVPITPPLHYSITPLLHYSITPSLRALRAPRPRHRRIPVPSPGPVLPPHQVDPVLRRPVAGVEVDVGGHVAHRIAAPAAIGKVRRRAVDGPGVVEVTFPHRQLQVHRLRLVHGAQ